MVGQPGEKATPLLTETMKYITVNPTWNVPPSIIHNEYLPAYARDPTVLARMGLKMERNRDGSVHIYQPPGGRNALGRIRFNFPNQFLVYQHDTPDKYMFAHDKRAYSHGCMRVQNPDKYAEVLLHISNPRDGYTADRIRNMYGTGERDIQLQNPIPAHLTYQTASVDEFGHLVIREDIYGRDSRLLAALKERRPPDRRHAGRASRSQRRGAATAAGRTDAAADDGIFLRPLPREYVPLIRNRHGRACPGFRLEIMHVLACYKPSLVAAIVCPCRVDSGSAPSRQAPPRAVRAPRLFKSAAMARRHYSCRFCYLDPLALRVK